VNPNQKKTISFPFLPSSTQIPNLICLANLQCVIMHMVRVWVGFYGYPLTTCLALGRKIATSNLLAFTSSP